MSTGVRMSAEVVSEVKTYNSSKISIENLKNDIMDEISDFLLEEQS